MLSSRRTPLEAKEASSVTCTSVPGRLDPAATLGRPLRTPLRSAVMAVSVHHAKAPLVAKAATVRSATATRARHRSVRVKRNPEGGPGSVSLRALVTGRVPWAMRQLLPCEAPEAPLLSTSSLVTTFINLLLLDDV